MTAVCHIYAVRYRYLWRLWKEKQNSNININHSINNIDFFVFNLSAVKSNLNAFIVFKYYGHGVHWVHMHICPTFGVCINMQCAVVLSKQQISKFHIILKTKPAEAAVEEGEPFWVTNIVIKWPFGLSDKSMEISVFLKKVYTI